MTYLNPLVGTLLSGSVVQQQAATDKSRQVRRAQAVARNIAAESDKLEHKVENAEAVSAVGDEESRRQQQQPDRRPPHAETDDGDTGTPTHIDVKG